MVGGFYLMLTVQVCVCRAHPFCMCFLTKKTIFSVPKQFSGILKLEIIPKPQPVSRYPPSSKTSMGISLPICHKLTAISTFALRVLPAQTDHTRLKSTPKRLNPCPKLIGYGASKSRPIKSLEIKYIHLWKMFPFLMC